MRKTFAVIGVLLVAVLLATPSVFAATALPGFPFKVWQAVTGPFAGNANIYIFTALGDWCGTATLTGVGPAGGATLAWETARDIIVTAPPLNGGVWYIDATPPPGDFCSLGKIGPLTTYYIE
ncbi:MAG: hypothetical protein HYS34_08100 [Acidobacteria bacterium]|nr:hypothetical protein [Acidobacteriota bacterium]